MVVTATAGDSEMSSALGKPKSLVCAPLIGDANMISYQEGVKCRTTIGRIYVIAGKGVEEVCVWYKQGRLLIPLGNWTWVSLFHTSKRKWIQGQAIWEILV